MVLVKQLDRGGEEDEESVSSGSYSSSGSSSSDGTDHPPPPAPVPPPQDPPAAGEKDAGDVEIGEATEADTTWQIDERSIEIPGDYVKKTKTLKRIAREEKMAARKEKMRQNKNFICCIIIMMILVIIAAVLASVLTRGSSDVQQGSPSTGGNIPDDFPGATGSSSGTVEDGY